MREMTNMPSDIPKSDIYWKSVNPRLFSGWYKTCWFTSEERIFSSNIEGAGIQKKSLLLLFGPRGQRLNNRGKLYGNCLPLNVKEHFIMIGSTGKWKNLRGQRILCHQKCILDTSVIKNSTLKNKSKEWVYIEKL